MSEQENTTIDIEVEKPVQETPVKAPRKPRKPAAPTYKITDEDRDLQKKINKHISENKAIQQNRIVKQVYEEDMQNITRSLANSYLDNIEKVKAYATELENKLAELKNLKVHGNSAEVKEVKKELKQVNKMIEEVEEESEPEPPKPKSITKRRNSSSKQVQQDRKGKQKKFNDELEYESLDEEIDPLDNV